MATLPLRLFGVVTEDVTPPPLTIADDDLLGIEVILKFGVAATFTENLIVDPKNGTAN
jgi:hypothetical protein